MAEDEEEVSWIFDSLICFLNGPIWHVPIESFIEEKSLIFEPNLEDNEEHLKIFDEFKNLVDFVLGSFMEDIGITSEQFENACNKGGACLSFNQGLFEQIWAANDFEMFKRMMTQRNIELQLQALELIERKYGIAPKSYGTEEESKNAPEVGVVEDLKSATEDTKDKITLVESVETILEDKKILEETLKETKEDIVNHLEKEIALEPASGENTTSLENLEESSVLEKEKYSRTTSADIIKRQEYLKAQRDKLVAMKKEERKKHLNKGSDPLKKSTVRVKSAKGEIVLSDKTNPPEDKDFHIRKTLAERLKMEVVGNKK